MPTIKCPPSAYIMTRQGKAFWAPRGTQGPQTFPRCGPPRFPKVPRAPIRPRLFTPRYPKALRMSQRILRESRCYPGQKIWGPGGRGKGPERRRYTAKLRSELLEKPK